MVVVMVVIATAIASSKAVRRNEYEKDGIGHPVDYVDLSLKNRCNHSMKGRGKALRKNYGDRRKHYGEYLSGEAGYGLVSPARIVNSTRRFWLRPDSVSLGAIGRARP